MQHVKKMAIVPQTLIERLMEAQREQQQLVSNTPVTQLSSLDQELRRVLESNVPADVKAKQYGQVLQQYSTIRAKEVNPSIPPSQPEPLPPKAQQNLLAGLAKTYINKGRMLMESISENPDLKWNERNEVIYRGERIPSSNIIDLIHAYTKRQSAATPTGWKEFGRALIDNNTPRSAIGNSNLLDSVDQPFAELRPSTSRQPVRPHRAVPSREPERRRSVAARACTIRKPVAKAKLTAPEKWQPVWQR
jgi:hypothetical protein